MSSGELPPTLTPKEKFDETDNNILPLTTPPVGRLLSNKSFLKSVDLVNEFTFGRDTTCTQFVTSNMLQTSDIKIDSISKRHFRINVDKDDGFIYIIDTSKNGTFINRKLLGRNVRKILNHLDSISITEARNVIYTYMNQLRHEDTFLHGALADRFITLRALGRGSCGEVRLVRERGGLFKQYAIKKIILCDDHSSQLNRINHPKKVENEIEILQNISHPCIIQMIDITTFNSEVYLVLEYMKGGDLLKRIQRRPMTEDTAKFYFIQIALATQYLHDKGIIHRDLKPENILLRDDNEETLLKISDFGLSRATDLNQAQTMCGTMSYAAPEVLSHKFRSGNEYNHQVDVWSMGVILYLLISQELPFRGDDVTVIKQKIYACNYNLKHGVWKSDDKLLVKDLIKQIFQRFATMRIEIPKMYSHDWIKTDHCVKFRLRRLLLSEGIDLSEEMSSEPSPKKYKVSTISSSLDSVSTTSGSSSVTVCCT